MSSRQINRSRPIPNVHYPKKLQVTLEELQQHDRDRLVACHMSKTEYQQSQKASHLVLDAQAEPDNHDSAEQHLECRQLPPDLPVPPARLNDILNSANASIVSFRVYPGHHWEYDFYSAGCELVFGYTAQEMMQGVWWSCILPEDQQGVILPAQADILTERPTQMEYRFRHKDDSIRWIASFITSHRNEQENCWQCIAVDVDITQRKTTEAALQKSEERLELALEAAGDGLWDWHIPTGEVYLSPRWLTMLGYEVGELLAELNTWERLIHPEDKPWVMQVLAANLKDSSSPYAFDYRLLTRSGSWKWIANYGKVVLRDQDGKPLRMTGTHRDISDRKYLEMALLNSESRLRDILNSAIAAIVSMRVFANRDWHYEYYSAGCETVYGYTAQELLADKHLWMSRVLPEDVETVIVPLFKAFFSKSFARADYRFRHKDGSLRTISCTYLSRWHPEGDCWIVTMVNLDISERAQLEADRAAAETALRQSEARYRTISQLTSDYIYSCAITPEGNTLDEWVTPNVQRITGYACEELLGQDSASAKLIHPEDWASAKQFWTEMLATNQPASMEYRVVNAQGEVRWFCDRAQPIWDDAAERVVRVLGAVEDITDRKQAEQKILEQAELINIAPDAIMVRDLSNRITFWSRGAERLYGWTATEAMGRDATELLFRDNATQIVDTVETVLKQGKWQGELPKVTRAGNEVIVMRRMILMRDHSGLPKAILTVDTDITEKKQLERQFLRAQRLESIGTLASGIAHDFNNLLTPILAAAQLLSRKFPESDLQTQELLQLIETNAKRGATLIRQVLSFARGADGKYIPLQLRYLIMEICQIVQQTFPETIPLSIDLPTDLWRIRGDITQLHQVFLNLCVNARDAMPEGGTLQICGRNMHLNVADPYLEPGTEPGDYVAITVSDTGTGIAPQDIYKVFEPFFTTKALGKGTGLGLSTALGIIRSHRGYINVSSQVGQGTKFQVLLPAIYEPSQDD
jgi:hypothetical protein